MQPRPSSRIKSLEERASTIEAKVIELGNDTAEELKAIQQDIKDLDKGMMTSFEKIGDTLIDIVANKEDLTAMEARITATMATKEDLSKLRDEMTIMEGRIEGKITAMESRLRQDIVTMEVRLVDTIKQLWQQRPSQ